MSSIVEIYVKAIPGRCAVVIVDSAIVLKQVGWDVQPFFFDVANIVPDAENCEIVAVCYGLQWCREHGYKSCNIYSDSDSSYHWFYKREIPSERVLRRTYFEMSDGIDVYVDSPPREFWDGKKFVPNVVLKILNDLIIKR